MELNTPRSALENKATAERTKVRPMVPQGDAVDGVIIFTAEPVLAAPFASLLSSAEEAKEDIVL